MVQPRLQFKAMDLVDPADSGEEPGRSIPKESVMADSQEKMAEAIAFFEQMLQTMPEDRTSLEFLSVAYEQTGQLEKHRDCLIRLADCLLHEKDYENAQTIAVRLSQFSDYGPARAAVDRVTECVQKVSFKAAAVAAANVAQPAAGQTDRPDAAIGVHSLSRAASAAEIELVWYWKEHNFLAKEICMDILHILTDNQVTDHPLLISALALLDDQHPELTDLVMQEMQKASDVPPIPLELFDIQPAASAMLPAAFIQVRGVLPFAVFGNELLVAVLNPMNKALREEVEARTRCPCHFFFVYPRVWIEAAKKIG
jgi:hypothetical protein